MRRLLISALIVLLCYVSYSQAQESKSVFVGTFTSEGAEGIYLCKFDPETGNLSHSKVFKGIDNPNFLRISPCGRYLFAVIRNPIAVDPSGGSVAAYRIAANGDIEFINKQSAQGNDPCYVDVSPDGKWVAIANYGGGSVALYPVGPGGVLSPASSLIKHQGSGPNAARQQAPHAHSIRFSGDGKTLRAADLGTDQLLIYRLDATAGTLSPGKQPFVALPPGAGPRHFTLTSGEDYIYVANELNSTVSVLENNDGVFNVIQTVSTLPAGYTGTSYCADIHLSPDNKFVYVSNRGHQSIAVLSRDSDGKLTPVTHVSVEGDWPRNFTLDPSGKYMLVANQRSHNIAVFELRNGIPVFTGNQIKIPAPVCLDFL